MVCLTPFLIDVRFLRGRREERSQNYLQARFISGNSRPDQPGEIEAKRLEFFPLVKIKFITIDKGNL